MTREDRGLVEYSPAASGRNNLSVERKSMQMDDITVRKIRNILATCPKNSRKWTDLDQDQKQPICHLVQDFLKVRLSTLI